MSELTRMHLSKMLEIDKELYERILDTQNFAYHFNELCRLALLREEAHGAGFREGVQLRNGEVTK